MTSINSVILSAPYTALMAGIPMIPSHVEAGRIVHVERIDQRAKLDPLIEIDPQTIAESQPSTSSKKFAKVAAAFSKDGRPGGSKIFEGVTHLNGLMEQELEEDVTGLDRKITVNEALRTRANIGHMADAMLHETASSLMEQGDIYLLKHKLERASAVANFRSAVLFAALNDYGNADEMSRSCFLCGGEFFEHPVVKALCYELAQEIGSRMDISVHSIHNEKAILRWLDAADLLSTDDPVGTRIALFRGIYLSSKIFYKPKIVELYQRYAALDEDDAEDYIRIARHIIENALSYPGSFTRASLKMIRDKLLRAQAAWDKAGDEEKSVLVGEFLKLISD